MHSGLVPCADKRLGVDGYPSVCVQISVDGDTSTNDTVIGLAGGAAGNKLISEPGSKEAEQLHAAVTALLQVLMLSVTGLCHKAA